MCINMQTQHTIHVMWSMLNTFLGELVLQSSRLHKPPWQQQHCHASFFLKKGKLLFGPISNIDNYRFVNLIVVDCKYDNKW